MTLPLLTVIVAGAFLWTMPTTADAPGHAPTPARDLMHDKMAGEVRDH
jgi:hypothetical protein